MGIFSFLCKKIILISSYVGNNNFYNNNYSNIELQFTFYKVGVIDGFFGEIKGGKLFY